MDETEARSLEERELQPEVVVEEQQGQQKMEEVVVLMVSWWYGLELCGQLARQLTAELRMEEGGLAVLVRLEVEEVPA